MFNLVTILIGSILIGVGTNGWVGSGIAFFGFGFHYHFNTSIIDMYTSLIRNLRKVYDRLL